MISRQLTTRNASEKAGRKRKTSTDETVVLHGRLSEESIALLSADFDVSFSSRGSTLQDQSNR